MAGPLAFSTTDISNGNSGKNNAKYRGDFKNAAIPYGISSKGVRYETIAELFWLFLFKSYRRLVNQKKLKYILSSMTEQPVDASVSTPCIL